MEEHPDIERDHTRVHEENKTEAGKVRWVRWVRLDKDGDSRTKMGTNPDNFGPDQNSNVRFDQSMTGFVL